MCKDYLLFKEVRVVPEGALGSGCVVIALSCENVDGNDFMFCANIYHHSKQ